MARHASRPQHASPEPRPAPRTHGRHGQATQNDSSTGRTVLLTSVAVVGSLLFALPGHSAPQPVGNASPLGTTDQWVPEPLLDVPASTRPTSAAQVPPASVTPADLLEREIPSLPSVALAAYRAAAARQPSCGLSWAVLAGIGDIESGQARDHGSANPGWDGIARPAILGPVLDGGPFAAIADTDGGVLDGDPVWDRAVGPMQFLPSTWRRYGVDMDHTGKADPENIRDAAAAAAAYLCVAGGDLSTTTGLTTAIYAYNHSTAYVRQVLCAALTYGAQTTIASALSQFPADPSDGLIQHGTIGALPNPSTSATPTLSAVPQPTQPPVISPWPTAGTSPATYPAAPSPRPSWTPLPSPTTWPLPTASPGRPPSASPLASSDPAPHPSGTGLSPRPS